MATLSKSKYTLSCQCPKALWLKTHLPNEAAPLSNAQQSIFAAGQEVGLLAKKLFGEYTDTTTTNKDGSLDIPAMIAKTQVLVNNGCPVICEAAFAPAHHYCAVDILRKTDNGWAIYEVKSSTSHADDPITDDKFGKYATDIAYQRWVLQQCGIKVTHTYLVTINSDYVRHGELDLQQLFNIIDLSHLVENEYLKVPNQTALALQIMDAHQEPNEPLSVKCHKPYDCAFWKYCTQTLPQPSVFDMYGMRFDKKLQHYHNGIISFDQVAQQKLTAIQNMQVHCTMDKTDHINPAGIQAFLNTVTYPLYFLDFESMQPAIPAYDNSKPYTQICFQYSLHYIEHKGGKLQHTAFLAPSDGSDPRRALSEALCRDIPRNACIMAYNDPFEKTRIKEMANIYPDLADHLMNIHNHIIDLLIPFREGNYYRPAMGGSFSIKVVLPALFPNDEALNYHNLSELVQDGVAAKTIFPEIQHMPPVKAEEARNALLEYCHLDTLAMVRIWQKMIEIVHKNNS